MTANINPADGPPTSPLRIVTSIGNTGTIEIPTRGRWDPPQGARVKRICSGVSVPSGSTSKVKASPAFAVSIARSASRRSSISRPSIAVTTSPGNSSPSAEQSGTTCRINAPEPCSRG